MDSIQNGHLQRITTKLLGYNFKLQWIPGKKQVMADGVTYVLVRTVFGAVLGMEEIINCHLNLREIKQHILFY